MITNSLSNHKKLRISPKKPFVPLSDSEIIIENNDDFVGDIAFVFVSVVPFEIVAEIVVVAVVVVGYAYRRLRKAA